MELAGADERGRFRVTFRTRRNVYESVQLNLPGRHQLDNAAVAIAVAEALSEEHGLQISREAIITGLESAQHPGRLEWLEGKPAILFDGAHNEQGAGALHNYLDEFIKEPVTLLFGAMRDKDLQEMAAQLFPVAERLILTEMDHARSATRETLGQLVSHQPENRPVTITSTVSDALKAAMTQTPPEGLICVTGSLHLIGEVKTALLNAADKIYAS